MSQNADESDLKEDYLSQLRDSLRCQILLKLVLQLPRLTVIPHIVFEHMPLLEVLDLSSTSIQSLPSSVSSLSSLKELLLRDCSFLIELPIEIGMLTKLKLLDIEGSEIMYIPKEIVELTDLEVLRLCLSQYAEYYIKAKNVNGGVKVPRMMIPELKKLKELCISVGQEAEWWEEEIKEIQDEIYHLENLEYLKWYLPTDTTLKQFLDIQINRKPAYEKISNFTFTIGQHAQLTSCLPRALEKKFAEFEKCLKWINAEGNIYDISKIMTRAKALFLSRHWTIVNLSAFDISKLKYFLLAECNEMETLVKIDDLPEVVENNKKGGLESLEYLSIHYMEKLRSIWEGPIGKDSLSRLRILALHTCLELTTIFTPRIAQNLSCLAELTVEECPKVRSLISTPQSEHGPLFPSLEKIFLIDLPELDHIFGVLIVLEKLESLMVYNCVKLRRLSEMELPRIQKIIGENKWWNSLNAYAPTWENVFEPLKEKSKLIKQLLEATNSLQHFHDVVSREAKDEKPLDGPGLGAQETKIEPFNFPLRKEEGRFHTLPGTDLIGGAVGAGPGEVLSKLFDAVIHANKETSQYKSILLEIQKTLNKTKPIFHVIIKLIELQNRPQQKDLFIALKGAENIVRKCELVEGNYHKKYKHKYKLDKLNASLLGFCEIDAQPVMSRDMKETLAVVKDVPERMEDKRSSSGWLSEVPVLDDFVIGFGEQVKKLKKTVLEDSVVDDGSVVVVSAGGGSTDLIGGAVGAGLGEVLSKLTDVVIHVIRRTSHFKSILLEIQETLTRIKPFFHDIDKLIDQQESPQHEKDMFIAQIRGAEAIVRKCERIKWNYYKRYKHACKLDKLNASLLRFCQIDVQFVMIRDMKEALVVLKDVQQRMEDKGSSSGWISKVPVLDGFVIGFEDRVKELKKMVLKDSVVDDCSVVVVSAGGGYGKTTLVTKLCGDPDIQEKFESIYFANISETPNLKMVIKNLLEANHSGQQLDFVDDDDAIRKWGSFLADNKSEKLLVLDDVWSDSIIKRFKLRGYTILVTSRINFSDFETYQLELLSDEDANNLFCHSAFSEFGLDRNNDIPNDIVDMLVACCKNHPLTLSVIGGLLRGTNIASWRSMLDNLSEGKQSVFDLDENLLLCLSRSLDVLEERSIVKQCYLDLGLFPEDQKIAATMLMDMWVHLYKHDEEGLGTINQLFELSYKNLATLLPIRKNSPVIANYCEEKVVMQHELMRTLAIHLSSKEPEEERERLIIKPDGQDLPKVPRAVKARLLSISTGEKFSGEWNDMQAPKVEVLVMNFLSRMHPLPQFIRYIEKLKVLIITNYGYYFSKIENFPPPLYLSSLTSIRLDHVSISSISTSILELKNLRRLSLIMCKIGNSFSKCTDGIPNKLPSLLELDIESCDDLVTFPVMLCNLLLLRKLCITNCHELTSFSEEFGNFPNLDVLRLASCTNLVALPKTITNLQKLSIIDISDCINLSELPLEFGELGSLQTIYMRGCTGLHELPSSVKGPLEVVCDYETALLWNNIPYVKLQLEEEDKIGNFMRIVSLN